jgi:hypothetical protein
MPARDCRVSLTDANGVTHAVNVHAESLMEAVAVALRDLRTAGLAPVRPGPATAIHVCVRSTAETEHSVSFRQFESWLAGNARSPQERLLKDRLKAIVNQE